MPWNRSVIGPWDRAYADSRNRVLGGSWLPGWGPQRLVKGSGSGFEGLITGVFNSVQQSAPAVVFPNALGPVDGTFGSEKWVLFHFDTPAPLGSFISGWLDYPNINNALGGTLLGLASLFYDLATTDWTPATVTWNTRPVAALSGGSTGGPSAIKSGTASFPVVTAFGITPEAALDTHNGRAFCTSIVYGLRIQAATGLVLPSAIIDQFFWNHAK